MGSKNITKGLDESYSEENRKTGWKQKRLRQKGNRNEEEKKLRLVIKKRKKEIEQEVQFFLRKIMNTNKVSVTAFSAETLEERAAWWLNSMRLRHGNVITQEERTVKVEKISSQKKTACLRNYHTEKSCQIGTRGCLPLLLLVFKYLLLLLSISFFLV